MNSQDWKSIVATVAPQLAGLLGGPLAGMAVSAIAGKILGNPAASAADVQTAILSASPADLIKLKEVEAEIIKTFEDAGVRLEEIAAGDRANAREREMKVNDWAPRVLACVVVIGWVAMSAWLHLDPDTKATANAALMLVLSFYYGSSSSSRVKDDTMNALSKVK